jgi:NADPH:quinone reductase-like Zn-dependent oxidoreductase
MTSLPEMQLGLLSTKTEIKFQQFPVPTPGPNEVLIKNVAVASNPKDWKVPQWMDNYVGVEGNDIAGHIVKVGEGVTEYKGGERVAAFTKMRSMDPKVCIILRTVHVC